MKNQLVKTLVLGLGLAGLVACAPPNKKLEPLPETPGLIKVTDGLDTEFNNQVDVLFVIDNSASMRDEQETLSQNIDVFVNALARTNLDYHIGILTVGDRARIKPGTKNYYPTGRLRPLKAPGDAGVSIENPATPRMRACTTTDVIAKNGFEGTAPGFVTPQTPNQLAVLKESLKVGVQCLPDGGPEHEELFYPVLAALEPSMRNGPNKGFYRDGAHLAVIIVSDATPSNDVSSEELAKQLRALKGEKSAQLLSLHAIGVTASDMRTAIAAKAARRATRCEVDPGLESSAGADELEKLTLNDNGQKNGQFLSLCSGGWGAKLVNIGADIRRRVLSKVIKLPSRPETGTIAVTYGSQLVSPSDWSYDCATNSVLINEDIELKDEEGAALTVSAVAVTDGNLRRAGGQICQ